MRAVSAIAFQVSVTDELAGTVVALAVNDKIWGALGVVVAGSGVNVDVAVNVGVNVKVGVMVEVVVIGGVNVLLGVKVKVLVDVNVFVGVVVEV
jgi:hypothetical protein